MCCFLCLIGFVLFDASSVADFWDCIVSMFGGGQIKTGYDREPVLSEKLCSDHPDCGDRGDAASCEIIWKIAEKERLKADADIAEILLLVMLLLLCVAFLVDGSFNPFLYFRF